MVKGNYWDYVAMYNFRQANVAGGWVGAGFNLIGTKISDKLGGSTCPNSNNNLHYGEIVRQTGAGRGGRVDFECKCDYCGGTFIVTKTSDELSAAYNNYVQTLPSTSYTSDGAILWHPTTEDVQRYYYAPPLAADFHKTDSLPAGVSELDDKTGYKITGRYTNGELSPSDFHGFGWRVGVRLPISGLYASLTSTKAHGAFFYADGSTSTYAENWPQLELKYHSAGDLFMLGVDRFFTSAFTDSRGVLSYNFSWFLPFFKIIPDTALNDVDYGMVTRPTSIEGGNYGIVGDNGQITKVENNSTIVNETNNTYYNPATGQTAPITDWTYDYSDRSYTLTLEGGKTSTVTYGDEYITIQEGDTVYNVYYIIEGSGSENPPAACVHDWQETGTTPATCTLSGSRLLTCSKCRQTKSETVHALGHDWQVKQTVATRYDDTGQLIQQGYTLFECSRCREQYKSTDGTAPPGSGSGTDPGEDGESIWDKLGNLLGSVLGGLIGMVNAVLGKILDALTALTDMLMSQLRTVVETVLTIFDELPKLFGGFLGFLSAAFPFLPKELMTLLTFGIAAVVFIGILKAVRR